MGELYSERFWQASSQKSIILLMRTVGQLLKETRESKLYTLEDIEKHTKIRRELLKALEEDDYDKLPPLTFIQGFVKNYGKFLGIDSHKLMAILRRDFEAKKHPPMILESFSNPMKNKKIFITPSRLIGVAVAVVIIGFFAYLWVEYRQFVGGPKLELASPQNGQTVELTSVFVEGVTDPETKITVNEQEVGTDSSGYFKEEVKLSQSVNVIIVTATSKFGQSTKEERTVYIKK
jgi:cytoskeletal protein RodZ